MNKDQYFESIKILQSMSFDEFEKLFAGHADKTWIEVRWRTLQQDVGMFLGCLDSVNQTLLFEYLTKKFRDDGINPDSFSM